MRRFIPISILALCFIATATRANADDIISDALLGGLESKADAVIDHARDAGDFLAWRIGQEVKAAIKEYKDATADLINLADQKYKDNLRLTFNKMSETLDRLERDETVAIGDAQALTAEWGGLFKDIPFTNHDPEVLTYGPRVFTPIGDDAIPLKVLGPKLSTANPSLFDGQTAVNVSKTTDNELVATLDRSKVEFKDVGSTFKNYKLNFDVGGGLITKPKRVERDIVVWLLPRKFGHVTVTTRVKQNHDEATTHPQVTVGGRGKNSRYPTNFTVFKYLQDQGWRIDIQNLVSNRNWWSQADGDGGSSCTGLDPGSVTDTSFTFFLQLGRNKNAFHEWDAHQNCNINSVPLKRTVTQEVDGPTIERDLTWRQDEPIDLPPNIVSYVIKLSVFGSPTRVITATSTVPFGIVDLQRSDSSLLFRPKLPRDF